MTQMAEFWVGIAFVVFVLILLYYQVPKLIAKALDDRSEAIRKELDEARRLREEAQDLLADYQKKHRNVGQEAESILESARREAEAFAHETRTTLKDTLERRTQRAAAIDRALAAAEKIMREKTAGPGGAPLVDQSIRDLKGRLN
jgi:F-type H+-transporting ATPase subunit b